MRASRRRGEEAAVDMAQRRQAARQTIMIAWVPTPIREAIDRLAKEHDASRADVVLALLRAGGRLAVKGSRKNPRLTRAMEGLLEEG